MTDVSEILSLMSSPSRADLELVRRAHKFAEEAHKGHKRYSGEDFFVHLHETAKNLAKYGMKGEVIAAGLLHDSIEDEVSTEKEIGELFGEEILFLIKGVTKLGRLQYKGIKRHAESLRRLFVAISEDIRVLIIKLTDRLHNMQTIAHVPEDKQKRIAIETMEIYAPLAYRLGMSKLSRELEDLAFKCLEPKEYRRIEKIIRDRMRKDSAYLEKITNSLKKEMAKVGIKVLNTHFRIKGIKSLFEKIKIKETEDSVHDVLALRVLVENVDDCYKTLGVVHGLWRPVPGRIKDFIAFPKTNGYQSIQTTIFTGDGSLVEIQIRTQLMHYKAEYGVAAHSVYKGSKDGALSWVQKFISKDSVEDENISVPKWVKNLNEYQKIEGGDESFLSNLKKDFFGQRIFIFTPTGDVVDLPQGSTPIDFAYTIHSDIGDHMNGVKINSKMAGIDTKLQNGDIVEIITKKSLSPTPKWLSMAKTNIAKRCIRNALSKKLGKK